MAEMKGTYMKLSMKQLGGVLTAAALTVGGLGLLGSTGCDEVAEQCGLECGESVAKGNFSITGVKGVDGFFKATVDFKDTAAKLTTSLSAELKGLQADLGIEDAELTGGVDLAAAIKAKLEANGGVKVVIKAEAPKCEVDAQASFSASAECQVEAGCDVKVDPGKAEFECKGSCEVEASAELDCGASVDVSCTAKGPSVACEGSCKGSCTVELEVAAACEGVCEGTCSGSTDAGGKCDGECKGKCKVESEVAAQCSGSCSGECTVSGPEVKCEGNATAKCEGSAEASVMCNGKCEGDFVPPSAMVECDASANCNAQAKADASLKVECTPPTLAVKVDVTGSLTAEAAANLDFQLAAIKARLPKILVSLKKGELVVNAGAELGAAAKGAVKAALEGFSGASSSKVAQFKLISCGPAAFGEAATVIAAASKDLSAEVKAAGSLSAGLIAN